jgi:hypothetical protein
MARRAVMKLPAPDNYRNAISPATQSRTPAATAPECVAIPTATESFEWTKNETFINSNNLSSRVVSGTEHLSLSSMFVVKVNKDSLLKLRLILLTLLIMSHVVREKKMQVKLLPLRADSVLPHFTSYQVALTKKRVGVKLRNVCPPFYFII